ncbi:head maturation protease, ClpP-related [Microbacterium testaceum]|uniref:head maturation protease, ClpP-related n=1 Tax=Microbacterium testaceum TaxID=2033 RepID=UPI000734C91B|nr:head maturation protease, ClpP-related [Microbacterium testaceum]
MTTTPNIGDLLAGRDWFRLHQEEGSRAAVLHVYGTIGSSEWWDDVSSPSLVRELEGLDVDDITVYVNSPGGVADDGIAIMNALARHKATVTMKVDGLAASAATIILLGADKVVAGAGCRFMIHDAWSIAWGSASALQKTTERLEKLSQTIAGLYAQRAGGDVESWRAAMVEETWYTAEEAVEAGLADEVAPIHAPAADDGESAAQNVIPIADAARAFGWRHLGREAAAAPFIPPRTDAPARGAATVLPSSPEPEATNQKEKLTMSATIRAGLIERLGVKDADISDENLLAALDETLEEQADPTPGTANASASAPAEGTIVVDRTVWEQTQANAQRGAEARAEQDRTRRDGMITDALRAGKITPKSKDEWRSRLDKDETEFGAVLASLPANGALATEEIGHAVGEADDNSAYPAHWKR